MSSQLQRAIKKNGGVGRPGKGGERELWFNGDRFQLGKTKTFADGWCDSCTAIGMHLMQMNYTLQNSKVIDFLPQFF